MSIDKLAFQQLFEVVRINDGECCEFPLDLLGHGYPKAWNSYAHDGDKVIKYDNKLDHVEVPEFELKTEFYPKLMDCCYAAEDMLEKYCFDIIFESLCNKRVEIVSRNDVDTTVSIADHRLDIKADKQYDFSPYSDIIEARLGDVKLAMINKSRHNDELVITFRDSLYPVNFAPFGQTPQYCIYTTMGIVMLSDEGFRLVIIHD